ISSACTNERHRVDTSGRIVVEGKVIDVGARLKAGTTVVVLMEDELIRIIQDGRRLTTAPRRHVSSSSRTEPRVETCPLLIRAGPRMCRLTM
ncbi:hypothetical protein, partial [Streptomyces sp. bgisy022]|uniref:hypothetical protein n=1 Tax=Streptomyces sp. bgisy022 TaxID=3413769 RepID=UPI003D74FF8D